ITSNSHQVIISSRPPSFIHNKQKANGVNRYHTYKINDDTRNVISPFEALDSFSSYINQQIPSSEKLQYYESFNNEDDQAHLIIENIPFALSPVKLSQN